MKKGLEKHGREASARGVFGRGPREPRPREENMENLRMKGFDHHFGGVWLPPSPCPIPVWGPLHPCPPRAMGAARVLPELQSGLGRGRKQRLDPGGPEPAWELFGMRFPCGEAPAALGRAGGDSGVGVPVPILLCSGFREPRHPWELLWDPWSVSMDQPRMYRVPAHPRTPMTVTEPSWCQDHSACSGLANPA